MDPLEYAAEDAVLLFAGRVVETFHRSYDRSFRAPAANPPRRDRGLPCTRGCFAEVAT